MPMSHAHVPFWKKKIIYYSSLLSSGINQKLLCYRTKEQDLLPYTRKIICIVFFLSFVTNPSTMIISNFSWFAQKEFKKHRFVSIFLCWCILNYGHILYCYIRNEGVKFLGSRYEKQFFTKRYCSLLRSKFASHLILCMILKKIFHSIIFLIFRISIFVLEKYEKNKLKHTH